MGVLIEGALGGNNNRSIFIQGFLKDDILACVELEISYNRVIIIIS
jgi:hypothetical protein